MNANFQFPQMRGGDRPVLVLADLHYSPILPKGKPLAMDVLVALERCRDALAHARAMGFSVAFVRRVTNSGLFGDNKRYPSWLKGFEPNRTDMVFDHAMPSCYDSPEFAAMAKHASGNFVLAGLFSESTCLSTAVDAYHRGQSFIYLSDASASRTRKNAGELEGKAMDSAITHIISLYTDIVTTGTWIKTTSLNGGVTYGA